MPVIDLATATLLLLQTLEPKTGRLGIEVFLLNREVIETVVRAAEYHESLITKSRRLRIDPNRLEKIRLAERA